ncbi:MAG TPA: hypothetical protein VJL59_01910 [Anaerolineales bacterium]|nr:hypothetical protein [Anaerolineales bacterium]
MNPSIPIILLLLGAAAMVIGFALPRSRSGLVGLVPVAAVLLAVLSALILGLQPTAQVTVSAWQPESLFAAGLTLMSDRMSWLFALATLMTASAVFLTGLSRPGGPRLGPRTASLLITAAALAAVQAENLITLAITWAVLDMVYFLSLLLHAGGEDIEKQAVLSLAFNSAATFSVIAAALETLHNGQTIFLVGQSPLTDRAVLLLLLAVVFRLGVFPFHLGLPAEANVRQGLGTLLRLAPAAVALDLFVHILAVSPELPLKPWLSAAASIGLLVGALQWWDSADPRQGISFVTLAHSSLALLAALWGGAAGGAGVLAIGLALVLGGAALFLNNGFNETERGWVAPSVIGGLTLVGFPLTVGYFGAVVLYSGFVASGAWLLFTICIVGQILLTASYIRLALWLGEPLPKGEPAVGVAYLFGLAAPLLFAVIGGLAVAAIASAAGAQPVNLFSTQSLPALGAVAMAMLGGAGLWRFESVFRGRAVSAWAVASSAARLDWLYITFWDFYRFVGRILRTAAAIVEGEGGVLWTIVAALLVWLLFRGR